MRRVDYEWDPQKAQANFSKHGVDFADAIGALEDDLGLTIQDSRSEGEERFITLGAGPAGQLLVVVYTWREEVIRIVSARRSTPNERRSYEVNP